MVYGNRNHKVNPIRRDNYNPIFDSRQYEVEFDDGDTSELTYNLIAENIYAQCDPEGNQYVLLDSLLDFRRSESALSLADQKIVDTRGRQSIHNTTKGWQLCCQCKDGSTSWDSLNNLKEYHPVHTSKFSVAQGVDHEPAFNYWVQYVLKKPEGIISLMKKRNDCYLNNTHKFGIEMPKSVRHALELDAKNVNAMWDIFMSKEKKDIEVASEILDDDTPPPIEHQKIECHIIFYVNMEEFFRKDHFVAGGHNTKPPATITYAIVVS